MLTVIKFGGSSLSTAEKIYNAARIAAEHKNQGKDVVMVVLRKSFATSYTRSKPAPIACFKNNSGEIRN